MPDKNIADLNHINEQHDSSTSLLKLLHILYAYTVNPSTQTHTRDLRSSLQQGVGFGIYINIGGGQK